MREQQKTITDCMGAVLAIVSKMSRVWLACIHIVYPIRSHSRKTQCPRDIHADGTQKLCRGLDRNVEAVYNSTPMSIPNFPRLPASSPHFPESKQSGLNHSPYSRNSTQSYCEITRTFLTTRRRRQRVEFGSGVCRGGCCGEEVGT